MPGKRRSTKLRELDHLVLYSTNTWLAHKVSKEYYDDFHFVWCSPYFSARSVSGYEYTNPPSSSPGEIYDRLFADVAAGDRHSAKIQANRDGIIEGAKKKAVEGRITRKQLREIRKIVKDAEMSNFRPLLYIIPFVQVINLIKDPPIDARANPLSKEYIIERLPRSHFDIIEFRRLAIGYV
jgi:hypothetical protein